MFRFAIALILGPLVASSWAHASADEPEIAIPAFNEETAGSGINSIYAGDWEYMVGGGVAAFDCDDDGFPDLMFAGGEGRSTFYRNVSASGGALRFAAEESGLELDHVTGGYPLDIDADGAIDLVLLRVGENVIMRGLGGCRFERANEDWGFDGGDAWSTALAATWEQGAQWPTLAVGNYIDRREEAFPWGSCTDNWLHRPREGSRGFAAPVALKPSHCALSMLFTDWNRSGTPDLRISNDREYYKGGQEQLWRFEPGLEPAPYTEADGWKRLRIWGMGIASSDFDRDGYPDYFLTSMADNKLQVLSGSEGSGPDRPDYDDIAYARGVTAHRPYVGDQVKPSTAWHAQFDDVNNDGRVDLFIAKGNVAEMPDFAAEDPNNLLLQLADGNFYEAGGKAGVGSVAISRGALLTDLNLDGLLDLVVANRWSRAQVWRNTGPDGGHWIQVRLRQDGPNRDAVGAWMEVKGEFGVVRREITVGGGHASGQSGWWHAGIGNEPQAHVRVVWPDGTADEWQRLEADNFYLMERGRPARGWEPR